MYESGDEEREVKEKPVIKPKNAREQYKCTCGMLLKNRSGVPYEMHIKSKYHIENTKNPITKRRRRLNNC